MRPIGKLLMLTLTMAMLTACALPRGAALTNEILKEQNKEEPTFAVVPVTRDNVGQIAKWPATGWSGGYHWVNGLRGPSSSIIRTGDLVNIIIWDSQENSLLTSEGQKTVSMQGMTVSPTGTVFVPYVDEIEVRGMTAADARSKIQKALEPVVPSAQVQLSIEAGKDNSVDLVSGVANPGSYPLRDRNSTILSLIAQGGGISSDLKNPLVRLVRDGRSYEIRAERLFSDASKNSVLRGNDQIIVEEDDRYFTALGATGSERLVPFEKEYITALEAISIIGGLSDTRANPKGVLILREYPARTLRTDGGGPSMSQTVFTFDLTTADGLFAARNFEVNPKDTVLATESVVTSARTVLGLIGSVFGVANTVSAASN